MSRTRARPAANRSTRRTITFGRAYPAGVGRGSADDLVRELGRVRDGELAHEALADVRGGSPIALRPVAQERDRGGGRGVAGRRHGEDVVREVALRGDLGDEGPGRLRGGVADDRHLLDRGQVGLERPERVSEPGRRPRHRVAHQPQGADARLLVRGLARQVREPQQDLGRGGVAARDGVVRQVLRPDDERLRVVARLEEAAAFGVAEQAHELVREGPRVLEPPELEGRLVQDQARIGHRRVVVRERGSPRTAVAPRTQEPARAVPQMLEDELGRPDRGLDVARRRRTPARPRRARRSPSRSRPRAPCRRSPGWTRASRSSNSLDLAASRSRSSSSGSSSSSAATASSGRGRQSTLVPSQLPPGVAPNAVATASPPTSTSSSHDQTKKRPSTPSLSASWEEKKPPSRMPASRGARSRRSRVATRAIALVPRDLPRVDVQADQERVVVEHLLEVRDEPSLVGRVAVEPAAELVVDAAAGHPVERRRDQLAARPARPRRCMRAGRTRSVIGCGNFGALAEAAPARVERAHAARRTRRAGPRSVSGSVDAARRPRRARSPRSTLRALGLGLGAPVLARRRRRPSAPCGTTAGRGGRSGGKYVPAKKGRPSGVRNDGQRPAAAARSSPGRRPCRSRRGRGAPRGRP